MRDLTRVSGGTNKITVEPNVSTADVAGRIDAAFGWRVGIDARPVSASAEGGPVLSSSSMTSALRALCNASQESAKHHRMERVDRVPVRMAHHAARIERRGLTD